MSNIGLFHLYCFFIPQEQTPPRAVSPQGADSPLGADNLLGADTPPPTVQSMLGDTVNARAVRILLECTLVLCCFFKMLAISKIMLRCFSSSTHFTGVLGSDPEKYSS